jgi:hypothetical protein
MEKLIQSENPGAGICKWCSNQRKPEVKTGRPRRYCDAACSYIFKEQLKWYGTKILGLKSELLRARTDSKWAFFTEIERVEAEFERLIRERAAYIA